MTKLLALDFGGSSVKYGLVDDEAQLSGRGQVPAPLESREQFAQTIIDLYEAQRGEVAGVAISMPGAVDHAGNVVVAGVYSKTMVGANLFELLADIDVPISVEVDGLCATLAELWAGSLAGRQNGAVLVLGSGMGGAIVIDGKLHRGPHGAAGAVTLMLGEAGSYDPASLLGLRCATSALLMDVAAAKGLNPAQFDISGALVAQPVDDLPEDTPRYTGKDVFRWIDEGDEPTLQAYHGWLSRLALAVQNVKTVIDAEVVAIGGGVSRNPRLVEDLRAELEPLNQMQTNFGFPPTEVCACTFAADANLIGAAAKWFDEYR